MVRVLLPSNTERCLKGTISPLKLLSPAAIISDALQEIKVDYYTFVVIRTVENTLIGGLILWNVRLHFQLRMALSSIASAGLPRAVGGYPTYLLSSASLDNNRGNFTTFELIAYRIILAAAIYILVMVLIIPPFHYGGLEAAKIAR